MKNPKKVLCGYCGGLFPAVGETDSAGVYHLTFACLDCGAEFESEQCQERHAADHAEEDEIS